MAAFDLIVACVADATTSFTEAEALRPHWDTGDDG